MVFIIDSHQIEVELYLSDSRAHAVCACCCFFMLTRNGPKRIDQSNQAKQKPYVPNVLCIQLHTLTNTQKHRDRVYNIFFKTAKVEITYVFLIYLHLI